MSPMAWLLAALSKMSINQLRLMLIFVKFMEEWGQDYTSKKRQGGGVHNDMPV